MLRQSGRLLSMGYYDNDEEPRISYRESKFRVFRRRRKGRHNSGASTFSNVSSISYVEESDHLPTSNWSANCIWTRIGKKRAFSLLFIILMCLGGSLYKIYSSSWTCVSQSSGWPDNMDWAGNEVRMMQAQLTKMQEELLALKNKIFPLADTMPNFALESQGAAVHNHLSSETHYTQPPILTFWGICLWYPPVNPRTVIQGHSLPLTPGRCWAFAGTKGHLFISLSHPITITYVTLGHISSMQSFSGFTYSAPREFSVYGVRKVDGETIRLGSFIYDPNGESLQTFRLPGPTKGVFRFVKLQIESNWGHPEYTCVYNFRVHGKVPQMSATT